MDVGMLWGVLLSIGCLLHFATQKRGKMQRVTMVTWIQWVAVAGAMGVLVAFALDYISGGATWAIFSP